VELERPNWSALGAMFNDVRRSLDNVDDLQKRLLKVTGTAWSDDRLVKAVVGPRGHLIELELDPRLYRKPNSKALSASIVATVRAAIEEVQRRSQEILDESLPSDVRRLGLSGTSLARLAQRHDADVLADGAEDDDG
jgi:DNA-binding protein YbaB